MKRFRPFILAALALAVPLGAARADGLVVPNVPLSLGHDSGMLTLSWPTLSVITNAGRTPIFPRHVVEASTDLIYWWPTTVVIPQRVGGPSLTIQTNFAIPPVLPVAFVRLRSELELAGADLSDADVSYLSCVNGNLENVDFDECHGEYANFQGAIMKKSSLRDSDFSLTDFRSVNFSDSEFELTDFRFADFRGADMDDVTAWFCDFTGAQFWGAP